MNTNFSIRKSDTAVILFMGAFLAFAWPQTAEANAYRDQQRLEACQMALQDISLAKKYSAIEIDPKDLYNQYDMRSNIDWFLSQPDPMAAFNEWSDWARGSDSPYRLVSKNGVVDQNQAQKLTQMVLQMGRDIDKLNYEAKKMASDHKQQQASYAEGQAIVADMAYTGYNAAVKKWEEHAIASCGGVLAPATMKIEDHLRCTGEHPHISAYQNGGQYYAYNYAKNPEVIVDSLDDLLKHPAYAKMDAATQARVKSDVEMALAERAKGMGPTAITTISWTSDKACAVESCFSFTVQRQGSDDVPAQMRIAGPGAAPSGYVVRNVSEIGLLPFVKNGTPEQKAYWEKQITEWLNNPGDNEMVFDGGGIHLVVPGQTSKYKTTTYYP